MKTYAKLFQDVLVRQVCQYLHTLFTDGGRYQRDKVHCQRWYELVKEKEELLSLDTCQLISHCSPLSLTLLSIILFLLFEFLGILTWAIHVEWGCGSAQSSLDLSETLQSIKWLVVYKSHSAAFKNLFDCKAIRPESQHERLQLSWQSLKLSKKIGTKELELKIFAGVIICG